MVLYRSFIPALACLLLIEIQSVLAQNTGLPEDRLALRYRIEKMDKKGRWKPEKATRTFKKKENVRFRFMANVSGTLYVLNSSDPQQSLRPVFDDAHGIGFARHLGLGTHIKANRVGLWPRQDEGSAIRFTGHKGRERFLFAFVPDQMDATRAVIGVPQGAEDWDFEDKRTYVATGRFGQILFHVVELKSK